MRLEASKRKAYRDLFFFSKYVCGFDLMEEQPHKELCDVLMAMAMKLFPTIQFHITTHWVLEAIAENEDLLRKALIMLPRGAFKSTVATLCFPLWLFWHDQNLRLMIDGETLGNSKYYLAGMKDMITNNQLLRAICVDDAGNFLLEPNLSVPGGFNEDSIIFARRTRLGMKEPSVFCSGVDNARTGMHMEVIIMDDLVSDRNVKTPEQVEKTKDHYRFAMSLLEPTGINIVIGTRYHLNDLYAELLGDTSFFTLVRPAINDDGVLYFPSRLTQAFLDEQRKAQKASIFASQYMLNPVADDSVMFKEQDLRTYKMLKDKDGNEKFPVGFVKKMITVDLAISMNSRADDTVVMPSGTTAQQDIYVIDYACGHFTPFQTIDKIFAMSDKYGIIDVGVEVVAYQRAFIYMLQAEMKRRGKRLNIIELKAKGSKEERAVALVPYVEQHKFFIKEEHTALRAQMSTFPFAAHDDLVDAAVYITQMMNPYRGMNKLKQVIRKVNPITGY